VRAEGARQQLHLVGDLRPAPGGELRGGQAVRAGVRRRVQAVPLQGPGERRRLGWGLFVVL
jgi:hypothetical protein